MGSNVIKLDVTKYHVEECTHLLKCIVPKSKKEYTMKCIVLGETENGTTKIVVFGHRDQKGMDNLRRLRYVNKDRLIEKKV